MNNKMNSMYPQITNIVPRSQKVVTSFKYEQKEPKFPIYYDKGNMICWILEAQSRASISERTKRNKKWMDTGDNRKNYNKYKREWWAENKHRYNKQGKVK